MQVKTCRICAAPLPLHLAMTTGLCGRPECQRKFESIPADRKCPFCGRPLLPHEASGTACAATECQVLFLGKKREEAEATRRTELMQRGRQLRADAAVGLNIVEPEDYEVQILPAFSNPLTPLPLQRRAAIRAHLETVIASGRKLVDEAPADESPGDKGLSDECHRCGPAATDSQDEVRTADEARAAAMGHACATCRGFCCRNGAEHAFLTAEKMRDVFRSDPTLTPEALLEAYLQRLPAISFDDGCVFQGEQGCTLPGEMRAQICHDFFCPDLIAYGDMGDRRHTWRAFFVAANSEGINAAAFYDERKFHPVPVKAPASH